LRPSQKNIDIEPEAECAAIIDVDIGRMVESVLEGRLTENQVAEIPKVPQKDTDVQSQYAYSRGNKTRGSRTYTVMLNRKIAALIDYIARKNGDTTEEAYAWIVGRGLRKDWD